ncbi:MAG TPA: anti-sigma factor [Gaiellales bacterium]|jgi:anti-sigma factor RsiW
MRLRRRHALVCREVVELVSDYLEGELDARDRTRFEAHLTTCDGCTAYVEQMRLTLRLAGRLDPEQLDPELRERLVAAFRDWRRQE